AKGYFQSQREAKIRQCLRGLEEALLLDQRWDGESFNKFDSCVQGLSGFKVSVM
ncbi:hypothetical protein BgiMline_029869, partial [Biomphalaria glabrata]